MGVPPGVPGAREPGNTPSHNLQESELGVEMTAEGGGEVLLTGGRD